MRCNVVAVGTELLLGQVVDTNSAWIGERLAAAGIDSVLHVRVGDNRARLVSAIGNALEGADAVVVCGGLGPTHDDLTREALADLMGAELIPDARLEEVIAGLFARRGRVMAPNNLRQALVPVGATVIPQTRGTAPGLVCPVGGKVIYAVPGVPHEMREMIERGVLPDLLARGGGQGVITSRVVRTWGESESRLAERLEGVVRDLDACGNPTLAFLASGWEGIKVRLTARAGDEASAAAILDEWESRVRTEVGDVVFGTDEESMESVVLDLLAARGLTLGLAESVTGGLVGGRLTQVPRSSRVFRGAVVSYASEVKFGVLGVTAGDVVTESAAAEMALGARRVLRSDVALALTGVAGPDEQEGKPAGTLCIAVAMPDGSTVTRSVVLPGQRDQMRQMSVITGLDLLRRCIAESGSPAEAHGYTAP